MPQCYWSPLEHSLVIVSIVKMKCKEKDLIFEIIVSVSQMVVFLQKVISGMEM